MSHPEKFGKYKITGVLGEGAMGVVYRGFDPDIRRVVALKTIRHQPGHSAESVEQSAARFRNEAQAAGRLLHPGIVGVYDFGDDGHVAYIAMEFVEGHTLSPYLTQKVRFGDADIASLMVQLLDALGHAHEHGVWHRDVKPSNVIMTKSGRVKIADFGIARTDNSGLTMANSVLGTPMYMAPEQFMGRPIDHRVDLYGAGVVMYQLISGRPPFSGSHETLMYKVVNEVPPPPSGAAVDGTTRTSAFDAVVAKALSKDPRNRHADAAAFRDEIAAALGQPVAAAVSAEAVHALPLPSDYATTQRITPLYASAPDPSSGSVPTSWDPVALARAEAALARHVGPLAGVLVRRAARECHDEASLLARLAEQIPQTAAREAFLGKAGGSGTGTAGTARTGGVGRAAPTGGGSTGGSHPGFGGTMSPVRSRSAATHTYTATSRPVSDAVLEAAQKLLAGHVGPIARVVVKRAAERSRQRETLFALLAESVPVAARDRLLADLEKLV